MVKINLTQLDWKNTDKDKTNECLKIVIHHKNIVNMKDNLIVAKNNFSGDWFYTLFLWEWAKLFCCALL